MSDPPSATASLTGKKKSRNGGTNVSKKLLMEFQALIAYACYDSPSISGAGVSMTESTMEKLMMKLCFGENHDNHDEMVCYVDQFLLGLNKFKGLYAGPPPLTDVDAGVPSELLLCVPPSLHRQGKIHIFVGEGSIEKRLLMQKSLTNESGITGRTMLRLAKDVLANCKKMNAIVTSSDSPYKDFRSFPSGTNYEDYLKWCLTAMFTNDDDDKGTSSSDTPKKSSEGDIELQPSTSSPSFSQQQGKTGDPAGVEISPPPNYFFKGFLAWCLWGHLPIENDGTMKSLLFTEAKVPTSFGRKTASRQSSKQYHIKQHQDGETLMGRRGTKRSVSESESTMTSSPNEDSSNKQQRNAILQQMHRFNAEYIERELQKRSALQVAIVRDKISALTRKSDRATEKLFRMKKGLAADELNTVVENLDREIENLETELRTLQEREIQRRDKVMMMTGQHVMVEENVHHYLEDDDVVEDNILSKKTPDKNTPDKDTPAVINNRDGEYPPLDVVLKDPPQQEQPSGNICVECSATPSIHKCRRCRRFVCTLCCSEKRHLDMIWWCGDCFENESITNQQQIRDGKYESDGEG